MKYCIIFSVIALAAISAAVARPHKGLDTRTVDSVDLKRYMGRWYEIARFDHSFERGMERCMADYAMLPDGTVEVINSGYRNGKYHSSRGKVRTTDMPGSMKVTFFIFPAAYNIIELDTVSYNWSVVGSTKPNFLWILSRTPTLPEEVKEDLLQRCIRRGYDVEELIWVPQP